MSKKNNIDEQFTTMPLNRINDDVKFWISYPFLKQITAILFLVRDVKIQVSS